MTRAPHLTVRRIAASVAAITGLAIGCGRSSTEPDSGSSPVANVAAAVAQVAATVTGQEAPLADEQMGGKHLGFDTHTYPGDKTMRAWINAPGAPYRWVGYYLPSPCHKDKSWTGTSAEARRHGLGARRDLRRTANLGTDAEATHARPSGGAREIGGAPATPIC